jgi:hypothetical protein
VRSAWLVLGANSIPLDNWAAGYGCTTLDLGSPDVRSVTYALPDTDGLADLTQFLGGRVVSADITALVGAGAGIDAVAAAFAPYMVPSARPELHYVLDRPGLPERVLKLRGAAYSWPIAGADERDIQLQWEAADPIARDPRVQSATAWSGSVSAGGRTYNLSFPRAYPGGGGAVVNTTLSTPGDVAIRPHLTVYGPITQPQVGLALQNAGTLFRVYFVASFRIDLGHRVEIDCANHTAFYDGDPTQSVLSSIDWTYLTMSAGYANGWPYIPPVPESAVLSLGGSSTNANTQCVATWQDGYLT